MKFLHRITACVHADRRRYFATCLLLGLVIRVVFLVLCMQNDLMYLRIDEVNVARRMRAGMGFSFDYYNLFKEEPCPSAFFPPAYVYNSYCLYKLFGSEIAIPIQNILLSIGIGLLLYDLTKRIFGEVPARLAMLLTMVYPPMFTRITHGSPVYFKMFLMVLLVLLFHRIWTGKLSLGLVSGAVAGCLALAMPDTLAYVLLFIVALVLRRRDWLAIGTGLLVLIGAGMVIAPWTLRNWRQFGDFCLISTNGGFNFYMGHNPDTDDEVDYSHISRLDKTLDGELSRANEFERDRILFREGFAYVAATPWRSMGNVLRRCVLHWGFRPENQRALSGALRGGSGQPISYVIYVWSYALAYALVLGLAVLGFFRSRVYWSQLTPIWLSFLYSTAIAGLFLVQTKMRLIKVEPQLLMLASVPLASLLSRLRRGGRLSGQ